MSFAYQQDVLQVESCSLEKLAVHCSTPSYIYASAGILASYKAYKDAFAQLDFSLCYAVKANSNLALLHLLANEGAWFDVVSGGELARVLRAGGRPENIVFSGVGKSENELRRALELGIHSINVESLHELALIQSLANTFALRARVVLRLNPEIKTTAHPYIATGGKDHKFGLSQELVIKGWQSIKHDERVQCLGLSCHIGSQIDSIDDVKQMGLAMTAAADALQAQGCEVSVFDFGGGLGMDYQQWQQWTPLLSLSEYSKALAPFVGKRKLLLEPGRSIVCQAGALLTKVLDVKTNGSQRFVVVDAGMNDMMRTALYKAEHPVLPVIKAKNSRGATAHVVGPVCETGDTLAFDVELDVQPGDLVAIMQVGAYGFTMASNYNTRPRPAEVMVDGSNFRIVRERETLDQMLAGEYC